MLAIQITINKNEALVTAYIRGNESYSYRLRSNNVTTERDATTVYLKVDNVIKAEYPVGCTIVEHSI